MKKIFLIPVIVFTAQLQAQVVRPVVTDVRWGGRTVALAVHPRTPDEVIAASASGGLFKTTDGGNTWRHLDNLPVTSMMDVKYNHIFFNKVIATCLVDTDTSHTMGIWLSDDRGETWRQVRPPVVMTSFGTPSRYNSRFSAYGISFDVNGVAYVGTDYGIATGKSGHNVWEHSVHDSRMPVSPDKTQNAVYSVSAFGSGKLVIGAKSGVYYCNDMYLRKPFRRSASTIVFDNQATHGIARSPFSEKDFMITPNPNQLFVTTDTALNFLEKTMPPFDRTSRGPVIAMVRNPTIAGYVDVYVHKVKWWKKTCSKDELRVFAKAWEEMAVEHDDMNAFGLVGDEVRYMGTDGGVFKKISENRWRCVGMGRGGYNALQAYQVWGQRVLRPGTTTPLRTDYYFGTQDNNLWSSSDAGATWPHDGGIEGGGFDGPRVVADATSKNVVSINNSNGNNQFSGPNFSNMSVWRDPGVPRGNPKYAGNGIYLQFFFDTLTNDIRVMETNNNGDSWREASRIRGYRLWQNEKASHDTAFTFYMPYARALPFTNGFSNVGLLRLQKKVRTDGSLMGYVLRNMDTVRSMGSLMVYPADFAWPVVYGFDYNDAYKLLAPDVENKVMKWSLDGGMTWTPDHNLTRLITENGRYIFCESPFVFSVWTVSFNPSNSRQIAIGTKDAGIVYTTNGGINWCRLAGSKQIPHITSIWWDFDGSALVSSYGRGIWRVNFPATPSIGGECVSNLLTLRTRDVLKPIADIPFVLQTKNLPVLQTKVEPATLDQSYIPMIDPLVSAPVVGIITGTTRGGEMVVGDNGRMTISGYGFAAGSTASIELDDKILVKTIPVNKDGTIRYAMIFKRAPGIYKLNIIQYVKNKKVITPLIVKIPHND
jgi:hypothetical protein